MKLSFAAFAAASISMLHGTQAQANVYSQVFCSCDDCCEVDPIDFTVSETVDVSAQGPKVTWTVNSVRYDHVAGLKVEERLTHFDIVGKSAVTCPESVAYAANEAGTMSAKTVAMKQINPTTCRVDWDGVFQDTASYASFNDIYVFFAFRDFGNGEVFIIPDKSADILTEYDINRPLFVTDVFAPVKQADEWGLQVNLRYFEERDAQECAFPDNVIVKMGDCDPFTLDLLAQGTLSKSFRFTPDVVQFELCAKEREERRGQIIYTLPLLMMETDITLPAGCDASKRMVFDNTTEFFVRVDVNVDGSTSLADISNVRTNIIEHGVEEPCDGLFSPQAKMFLVVETRVTDALFSDFEVDEFIYLEDATFQLDPTSKDCQSTGVENACTYRYISTTCVLMDNFKVGPDNNITACQFENIGEIRMDVFYTRTDGTQSLPYPFSDVLEEETFFTCSDPANLVNLDAEFPVVVTATARGGMNEPITVEMRFADARMDANSETTFKIHKIVVTHTSVSRGYEVDNKIALMSSEASPYYSDGHFCRFEPENSPSCEPFYGTYNNPFTQAQGAVYAVVGQGHSSCQNVNTRNVDRFTFTPNNWAAFEQLVRETSVTLNFQVFATLDTCLPSQTARRLLQSSDSAATEMQIVSANTTLVVGLNTEDDDTVDEDGFPIWILITIILAALATCCCGGLICFRRRTRNRMSDVEKPERPESAIVANQA